jgi:hypothetical protein
MAAVRTGLTAGFVQRIGDLTIWPRAQMVRTWFSTTQPTVPIVAVVKPRTDQHETETLYDVRFPFIDPPKTAHAFSLGDGDNRLPQGTKFVMRITAPATEHLALNPTVPVHTEYFTTLRRRATVRIQSIHVSLDGDPDSPGELTFVFAVYDAETRDRIGEPFIRPEESIPDGRTTAVDIRFPIEFAPDSLLLYAYAVDSDSYDFPLPGTGFDQHGLRPPDHLAAGEDVGAGSDDTWDATWGSFWINLPLDEIDSWAQSFHFVSPPGPVQFQLDFTVEAQVWSVAELSVAAVTKTTKSFQGLSIAGAIGQVAGAYGRGGYAHLIAIGHDRTLMVKRAPPPGTSPRAASWRVIGSLWSAPVTTLVGDDERVHVLTVDDTGAVRHRAWHEDADPSPDGPWTSLGGEMIGPVLTHTTATDVELFVRGRDGAIYHRRGLTRRTGEHADTWTSLGSCIAGTLDVVGNSTAGIHLIVHDDEGRVEHRWYDGHRWHPSSHDWLSLGRGGGAAVFTAATDDGGVAVVSIAEGGVVRWKEWRAGHWSPSEGHWESVESVDALLAASPSDQPSAAG